MTTDPQTSRAVIDTLRRAVHEPDVADVGCALVGQQGIQIGSLSGEGGPMHVVRVGKDPVFFYMGDDKSAYFRPRYRETIPEQHQKYCRCVLHVMARQPDWCIKNKAWFQRRGGRSCYNPYAVCTASLHRRGYRECSRYMDFEHVPENERRAYLEFEGLPENMGGKEMNAYFDGK
ncbi:MAG: hypothetical protein ACYCOU_03085 [Sulfobacillus sp.]